MNKDKKAERIPQWKIDKVKEVMEEIKKYPVIGVLTLKSLPSSQYQSIRKSLIGKAKIIVSKKTILKRALNNAGGELSKLSEHVNEIPALLLTNLDAFKLNMLIEKNQVPAFAKPGEVSPEDVVIKAGPTQFTPGPMIGEFAMAGIKTKVENGKLSILKDTTIVKKGEVIDETKAKIMKKLDKKPMRIGLTLKAVSEEGRIYLAEQLHIDIEEYINNIAKAYAQGINLAFNNGILIKETTELLLTKAHNDANNLAFNARILTSENTQDLLLLGESQAKILKAKMDEK